MSSNLINNRNILSASTHSNGFTILELLVVMFFFALISGLALPNLSKAYSSWQRKLVLEELLMNISQLNREAISQNSTIELSNADSVSKLPFLWPKEWSMQTQSPILFYANGVCNGGVLILTNGSIVNRYDLQAPYCNPI